MTVTLSEPIETDDADERPGFERRKGNCLLQYWRDLRQGRPYPSIDDVDPAAIPTLWRFCFLAERGPGGLRYSHLGNAVRRGYGMDSGSSNLEAPPKIVALLEDPCRETLATRAPVLSEGVVPNGWGDELRYRACVCPLSDDGENVSHLLGLVDYIELRREIVRGVQIETDIV